MKARSHPQIRPHQSADGVRIEKTDPSGLVRKEVARADRKPAGRDEGIEFVNVRSSWVGWFLHHPQDCDWGSGTTFGDVFDERTQLLDGQLLDALAPCCCDSLKTPHKVVRHLSTPLCPIVRKARDDAKATRGECRGE